MAITILPESIRDQFPMKHRQAVILLISRIPCSMCHSRGRVWNTTAKKNYNRGFMKSRGDIQTCPLCEGKGYSERTLSTKVINQ